MDKHVRKQLSTADTQLKIHVTKHMRMLARQYLESSNKETADVQYCAYRAATHVPPTSNCEVTPGTEARKGWATLCICPASSLVGETMMAPTCKPVKHL